MIKTFFLTGILSVSAFGAILENINSTKITFYYSVEGSKVSIKQCNSLPSADLDVRQCEPVKGDLYDLTEPIALEDFKSKVKAWTQRDLAKITSSIAATRALVTQKRAVLAEVETIINGLPEGSPTLPDYLDRKADLLRQIAQLESTISAGQAQLGGFDYIFGDNGFLAQDINHPIVDGQSTYLSVRPFVSHFLDVFKYRRSDPNKSIEDAKTEFAQLKKDGLKPYCAYWSAGFGRRSEIFSSKEGIIRTIISLGRTEPFSTARESCKSRGMELAVAAHIPGYHSHLWSGGSEKETWPVEKSTKLFADTDLAKSLPNFDYMGRKLKIFWVQITWYSRPHKPGDMDAFFMSPEGDWFRFNDGEDEGGIISARKLPVDPSWNLSVVCEKQYPTLPRYIDSEELPQCLEYQGWP